MLLNQDINKAGVKICTKCIYDERVPGITFDEEGVCSCCKQLEKLKDQYGTGTGKGKEELDKIINDMKVAGKGKKYDCVVGVSGGTDSSYLLYLVKQWGLRPLAATYDNSWGSDIAYSNLNKINKALDVDLYTYTPDLDEINDIFRAFFLSGVGEIEASSDIGLAEVQYRAAHKYNVKYILDGHSFIEEGVTPLNNNYFDGKYVRVIHKRFGRLPMKTFPLMTFSRFMWWTCVSRIRKIRPYWYIDYNKEDAKVFLSKEFGWKDYGGHHLENVITEFCHSVYLPQKCNMDLRNNTLSALVRNGKMSREEAWKEYNTPPLINENTISTFKKRLNLSDELYNTMMNQPPIPWQNFPTYKRRFEILQPLFHFLAKTNLVPMSFYMKYCFPMKVNE